LPRGDAGVAAGVVFSGGEPGLRSGLRMRLYADRVGTLKFAPSTSRCAPPVFFGELAAELVAGAGVVVVGVCVGVGVGDVSSAGADATLRSLDASARSFAYALRFGTWKLRVVFVDGVAAALVVDVVAGVIVAATGFAPGAAAVPQYPQKRPPASSCLPQFVQKGIFLEFLFCRWEE
jgi:hypothetical protein